MNIKSRKILAYLCAMAIVFPVANVVESIQNDINISAEDTTTSDTDTTDTDDINLVNGKVPNSIEDFEYKIEGGTVSITKYIGSNIEVVIPKEIEGYPVRAITSGAFKKAYVTSVTIPNTIVKIGGSTASDAVFIRCTSLKEIIFEENSNLSTIEGYTFLDCSSLKKVTFGENSSLSNIGNSAFSGCSSLTTIDIPDGVISIGDNAFEESGIGTLILPKSVKNIGKETFKDCTSLSKIDLGSVVTIPDYAFWNCTALTEIEIPSSVKSIQFKAFSGCIALSTLTLNEGLVSIGSYAFSKNPFDTDCSGATQIQNLVIPSTVESIGYYSFANANVKSLTLPKDISIGDEAFVGCKMKEINFQENTTIGDNAFTNCTSLSEITTNGVTSIGTRSFYGCSALNKATLSKDTTIGIVSEAIGKMDTSSIVNPNFSTKTTIYGYTGSSAETYAKANNIDFVALDGENPTVEDITGDVNHDGKVNIIDVVLLKKYVLGTISSLD